MASVDFMKFKSPAEFKRVARHCDKYERIIDGHRNQEIDKDLTDMNTQMPDRNYHKVCAMYEEAMEFLDAQPHANLRKDRVTCFGLEIPCPAELRESCMAAWFEEVFELICEQYDIDNVLQYYVHYDEVHIYAHAETGRWTKSRVHAHCLIIPEHEGRLCGKWFSSRENMIKLNNAIHEMSLMKYGVEFMDGSKKGSIKRVEQLKHESDAKAYEKKLREQEAKIRGLMDTYKLMNDTISNGGYTDEQISEIWQLGLTEYNKLHSVENQ